MTNTKRIINQNEIKQVFNLLRDRQINPSGNFDQAGRWHATNSDLIDVRTPSRAYPFSEMNACRTLKYVKKVAEKFEVTSIDQLKKLV